MTWFLKQLLPLYYETKCRTNDGTEWFCHWRMWFGRPFAIKWVKLS